MSNVILIPLPIKHYCVSITKDLHVFSYINPIGVREGKKNKSIIQSNIFKSKKSRNLYLINKNFFIIYGLFFVGLAKGLTFWLT